MKKFILIPILLFAINCLAQTTVEPGSVLQTTNQVYIKNQTDSIGARLYWYFGNGKYSFRIPKWQDLDQFRYNFHNGLTKSGNDVTAGGLFNNDISFISNNNSQFATIVQDGLGNNADIGVTGNFSAIYTSDNNSNTYGIQSTPTNSIIGRIGLNKLQALRFRDNQIIFIDSVSSNGARYSNHYKFPTGLYIPDKLAVDSIAIAKADSIASAKTITPFNGLNGSSGNVKLGGPLTETTAVSFTTFGLGLGDLTTQKAFVIIDPTTSAVSMRGASSTSASTLTISKAGFTFLNIHGGSNQMAISADTLSGISITDQQFNIGAVYTSDNSAIGKTLPRWIPDWAAVQSLDAGNVKLTGDQTITGTKMFYGPQIFHHETENSQLTIGGHQIISDSNLPDQVWHTIFDLTNIAVLDIPNYFELRVNGVQNTVLGSGFTGDVFSFRTNGKASFQNSSSFFKRVVVDSIGIYRTLDRDITKDSVVWKSQLAANTIMPDTLAVGNLYSQTTWNNFNDFTAQGNFTLVNGNIHITAGQSDILITNYVTSLSNHTQSYTYRATNGLSNAAGVRFGLKSINIVAAAGFQFWFDEVTRKINVFNVSTSVTTTGAAVLPSYTPGDLLTISVTYTNPTILFTLLNQTTGQSITYSATSLISMNRANLAIFSQNTTVAYDIQNITLSTRYKNGGNLFIGDSIDNGSLATPGNGYTFQLNGQIQAGNGDYTVPVLAGLSEVIKLKPETVYIKVGTNDSFLAIWQANIVSMVSTLENAGIRIVLISPPPNNTVDKSPMLAFLQAQYPTQTIDIFTPLKATSGTGYNPLYDSGDGVHPNQAGHNLIAATISANSLWHTAIYTKVIPVVNTATRITNTTVIPGYYNGLSTFKVRGDGRVENASTLGVQTNLGAMYYKTGGTIGVSSQVTINGSAVVANTFYGNSTWAATSQGTNFLSFLTAGNSNLVARMYNSGGMTVGVGLSTDPGTNIMQVLGRIGIGSSTVPTSRMHITAAGATSAGSSQLKFTSGPLMTIPEVGAFEFLTDGLYFTQTTGATRQQLAYLNSPTFTGTPTLPTGTIAVTQTAAINNATISTTAYSDRIKIDNVLSKTANYTVLSTDFVPGKTNILRIGVDASAGNVTITLPAAAGFNGYSIYITKTDASANTVTISPVLTTATCVIQGDSKNVSPIGSIWYNQ